MLFWRFPNQYANLSLRKQCCYSKSSISLVFRWLCKNDILFWLGNIPLCSAEFTIASTHKAWSMVSTSQPWGRIKMPNVSPVFQRGTFALITSFPHTQMLSSCLTHDHPSPPILSCLLEQELQCTICVALFSSLVTRRESTSKLVHKNL